MTTEVKRTHTLYLRSINREDHERPYSMIFEIPDGAIRLEDAVKENMKISLLYFKFHSDWSEINDTNNKFQILYNGNVPLDITIPSGNYPFADLAKVITRSQNYVNCRWDMYSNKLVFTDTQNYPMTITFTNNSWEILGFNPVDDGITGTTITSTTPLVPRQNTTLYMRLNGVTLGDGNLSYDNLTTRQVQPTTILSSIPVSTAPFQTQFFDNSVYGDKVALYVSNEKLNQLSIDIITKDNELATFISDWEATIKVEIVYAIDPQVASIKEDVSQMREILNRLLTIKVINGHTKNMF